MAFYLKESLGTPVPLLARFVREIFKGEERSKSGRLRDVAILSRPLRGTEAVRIEVPERALAAELEARLPVPEAPQAGTSGRGRKRWQAAMTRIFEEASLELEGVTGSEIVDEQRPRQRPEETGK